MEQLCQLHDLALSLVTSRDTWVSTVADAAHLRWLVLIIETLIVAQGWLLWWLVKEASELRGWILLQRLVIYSVYHLKFRGMKYRWTLADRVLIDSRVLSQIIVSVLHDDLIGLGRHPSSLQLLKGQTSHLSSLLGGHKVTRGSWQGWCSATVHWVVAGRMTCFGEKVRLLKLVHYARLRW